MDVLTFLGDLKVFYFLRFSKSRNTFNSFNSCQSKVVEALNNHSRWDHIVWFDVHKCEHDQVYAV